ncbi:MAG: hypothetical protein LBL13_07765 [Bacteroidales bacterium]|jgi:hypothetical protein|nr:hypothetical protein [Bacteroidales bacterium]
MRLLKTVRKIGNIIYKVYFKVGVKHVLPLLFGSFSADTMMSMYCNEDYMRKNRQV